MAVMNFGFGIILDQYREVLNPFLNFMFFRRIGNQLLSMNWHLRQVNFLYI